MSRSLDGLRILVTRAKAQASDLAERLIACGADPVVLPSIEFEPVSGLDQSRLDEAIKSAGTYDSVVLTSVRGVNAVESRLDVLGPEVRDAFQSVHLVAVGNVTADALERAIRVPDTVPTEFSAKGILEALGDVSGKRFLLLRADLAKQDLPAGLTNAGALVDDVVAYRIVKSVEVGQEVLGGPCPDILTFTSSSGVTNTFERLKAAGLEHWMSQAPIACIGPVTAKTVNELGFCVHIMAKQATIESLVESLCQHSIAKETSHA